MRPATTAAAVFFLFLCGVHRVSAQCVIPNGATANFGTVRLSYDASVPAAVQQGIANGAGAWNANGCNTNGTAFPRFVTSGAGDATINIVFNSSLSPDNSACATINDGGTTGGTNSTINLYSRAQINGLEYDCYPNADIAADSIMHELGHYLGLGEVTRASCPNHIMGPRYLLTNGDWDTSRQVQSDECAQADTNNRTPTESGGGGGGNEGSGGGENPCGPGQELWEFDCGNDGTWDQIACLSWWEDPYEAGSQVCY